MNYQLIDSIAQIINSLTSEEKAILATKINLTLSSKPVLTPLENEPFIGMWSDREDMKDSSQWVKNLRQQEFFYYSS